MILQGKIMDTIEYNRMLNFKLGTPAVYQEKGQPKVSGEIVMNQQPYKPRNGIIHPPRTIKGISLYKDDNYSGPSERFIVPASWMDVKSFYESDSSNQ